MGELVDDPREFLKEKLGEEGLAKFEEGARLAAEAKGETPDVQGQSPSCPPQCRSYCDSNSFLQTGAYQRFSF